MAGRRVGAVASALVVAYGLLSLWTLSDLSPARAWISNLHEKLPWRGRHQRLLGGLGQQPCRVRSESLSGIALTKPAWENDHLDARCTSRQRIIARSDGAVTPTETPVPVWVINLDKSVERWNKCSARFAEQHVSAERFSATYGKLLSEDELLEKTTFGARHFITPGMIGCFLSHQRIWQRVVDEGHSAAVALEDDVILYPDFNAKLSGLLDELPADWDVCLLGAIGCIARDKEPLFTKLFALAVGGWRASPGKTRCVSSRLYVPLKPTGTHAYMISQRGAAKLLEKLPKARYHVDLSAWSIKDLKLYAAKEFLATQDFEEESTVAKTASRSQKFLRWVIEVFGLGHVTRKTGAPISWAWKVVLFALPTFGLFNKKYVLVTLGPASAGFVLMCMLGVPMRSFVPVAVAFALQGSIVWFMRWMSDTSNTKVTMLYVAIVAFFLYLS